MCQFFSCFIMQFFIFIKDVIYFVGVDIVGFFMDLTDGLDVCFFILDVF